MVRLKVTNPVLMESPAGTFQFHNGSIKSSSLGVQWRGNVRFNSTMVRLKGDFTPPLAPPEARFNSTMVRLKAGFRFLECHGILCFNSTMVRLKGYSWNEDGEIKFEFQFHNGSIKRTLYSLIVKSFLGVSIPQWFD